MSWLLITLVTFPTYGWYQGHSLETMRFASKEQCLYTLNEIQQVVKKQDSALHPVYFSAKCVEIK